MVSVELMKLLEIMVTENRRRHILAVRDFALLLSYIHNSEHFKVEIAALSHDLFRDVEKEKLLRLSEIWKIDTTLIERKHPVLLHGKVAAEFLKRRFGVVDREILLSVAYHTSGHPDFGKIGKIITVADTVSYDRDFPVVDELRKKAFSDLEEAFYMVIKNRLNFALNKDRYILEMGMKTWNSIVDRRGMK